MSISALVEWNEMKSTWFGDSERYQFAKTLREADYSQDMYRLFSDWLFVACSAFRQAAQKALLGSFDDELEQRIIDTQKRFKKPEKLSHALAILTMSLDKRHYDFLGTVLSELSLNDRKWKGQCFTPPALSQLMADLLIDQDLRIRKGELLEVSEPACGFGSIIIATAERLKQQGAEPHEFCFIGTDVDIKCFQGTLIQTTLLDIPCGVIQGNTLTLEVVDSAWNLPFAMRHPTKVYKLKEVPKKKKKKRIRIRRKPE